MFGHALRESQPVQHRKKVKTVLELIAEAEAVNKDMYGGARIARLGKIAWQMVNDGHASMERMNDKEVVIRYQGKKYDLAQQRPRRQSQFRW